MSTPLWLIRTGGMIIGPFTKEEVGERILTREVTGLDEAAQPKRVWRSVREITDFSEFLKNLEDGPEETTGTSNATDIDFTQTLTLATDHAEGDLTEEIPVKEIIYHDLTEELDPIAKNKNSGQSIPSFGVEGNPAAHARAEQAAKPLWVIVGLVVLIVAGFVGYRTLVKAPADRKNRFIAQKRVAAEFLKQGRYNLALEKYEQLYDSDPSDKSIYLQYATLKLQLEKDTLLPKKLYGNLIQDPVNPIRARANLGLGLAHLMDNELGLAENSFREALSIEPNLHAGHLNLGIKEMINGNWKGALQEFSRAENLQNRHPIVLLNLIRANVEMVKLSGGNKFINKAYQKIGALKTMGTFYTQEALLFKIYLDLYRKANVDTEASLKEFLDSNPYISENYKYNVFVNQQFIDWKALSSYCSEIIANIVESHITKAFEAFCLAKSDQLSIAKTVIEDAINRSPRDPLVNSVFSYILTKLGLDVESSVALSTALRNNSSGEFALPSILKARLCARSGDWDCSKEEWNKVLQKQVDNVAALTGIGEAHLELGEGDLSLQFLNRARAIGDDYVPLQVLQSKLER
tara:strand:- start:43472 stop:45202 length:1731 start_codon:yes stop_codon:yes gene_type:complete